VPFVLRHGLRLDRSMVEPQEIPIADGGGIRKHRKGPTGDWIEIDSSLEKVEETVEEILCSVNGNTLPNERLFGLRVALQEALNNAICHGNSCDPNRKVHVRSTRLKDRIEITVRDEGEGFDCTLVPDPTREENLFQSSGRGIFLMRQLVDEVRYNECGNEVTLVLKIPPKGRKL
jgi:serine/threonine-protein kinase RsbW